MYIVLCFMCVRVYVCETYKKLYIYIYIYIYIMSNTNKINNVNVISVSI